MNSTIKQFIEENIEYIDNEMYVEMYEKADDWLSDAHISELTALLIESNIANEQTLKEAAMSVVANNIIYNFSEFIRSKHDVLNFSSFVRMFMNTLCGIPYKDVEHMILTEFPDEMNIKHSHSTIIIHEDHDGHVVFSRSDDIWHHL